MGDLQPRLVDLLLPVEEEVEVEGSGPQRRNGPPVAAECQLELEQRHEQSPWRKAGFELDGAVQEAWLVDVAHGVGVAQGGHPDDPRLRESAEAADGGSERPLAVAEVRAQADKDSCHDRRVVSRLLWDPW